jgi:hypothetical protein
MDAMNAHFKITDEKLNRILDRSIYAIVWLSRQGDINFDGDHNFTDMTRENAIEQFREGHVLRVFELNLIEGGSRDVTAEIEEEAAALECAA